jgi:hypothetical protein
MVSDFDFALAALLISIFSLLVKEKWSVATGIFNNLGDFRGVCEIVCRSRRIGEILAQQLEVMLKFVHVND